MLISCFMQMQGKNNPKKPMKKLPDYFIATVKPFSISAGSSARVDYPQYLRENNANPRQYPGSWMETKKPGLSP